MWSDVGTAQVTAKATEAGGRLEVHSADGSPLGALSCGATGGGLLVEPLSAPALAAGLAALLDDPAKRRELGARGRRAVLEGFGDQSMAERTLGLYRELVDRNRATAGHRAEAGPSTGTSGP